VRTGSCSTRAIAAFRLEFLAPFCFNQRIASTFLYALTDPRPGDTHVYVGKADDPQTRYWEHQRKVHRERTYKAHWWRNLIGQGLAPKLEVLAQVPFDEWEHWEREYIRWYRVLGWNVLNATDGGDGGAMPWPPEARANLSASLKRSYTQERRDAISAFHKGRKKSAATCAKMSASGGKHLKGKRQSPEHVAKCRAAKLGKKFTVEHKAKIGAALKGQPKSDEARRKMSIAAKARCERQRLTSTQNGASLQALPSQASTPT